jgi:hypothetical protein
VTATPESPSAGPDCAAVEAEFVRRLPGLEIESLRVAMQVIQARLGTAAEQPCDFEKARALGHEINNRLTATKLETDLRRHSVPRSGSF